MKRLKIVFMGTPEFAVPSLEALIQSGFDIVAVITVADKAQGRGKKLSPSPVKVFAQARGLNILQPENLKAPEFIKELEALQPDLGVVVAFRMLPQVVWNLPKYGTINLHGSLLPQYRGAAPINWAIINGEKETGVSTFFLQQEIDTGRIIAQKTIPILPEDCAGDLHDRMMHIGAELLAESVIQIEKGEVTSVEQSNAEYEILKAAPKIFKADCQIQFSRSAQSCHDFIRGLSPFPGAWTKTEGKTFKILQTRLSPDLSLEVGQIKYLDLQLFVGCQDYALEILSLQMEGKRRMTTAEFLRGHHFADGAYFA